MKEDWQLPLEKQVKVWMKRLLAFISTVSIRQNNMERSNWKSLSIIGRAPPSTRTQVLSSNFRTKILKNSYSLTRIRFNVSIMRQIKLWMMERITGDDQLVSLCLNLMDSKDSQILSVLTQSRPTHWLAPTTAWCTLVQKEPSLTSPDMRRSRTSKVSSTTPSKNRFSS